MKRVSPLEKLYYVRRYLSGEGGSQQQCADEAGVTKTAFQHWLRKFETFGEEAFLPRKNARYPEELKQAAVKDYHSGELSQRELCRKYRLSSMRQLYDWIRQYDRQSVSETAGEPDVDSSDRPDIIAEPVIAESVINESVIAESGRSGREVPHRGRETTWEERLEIVPSFCFRQHQQLCNQIFLISNYLYNQKGYRFNFQQPFIFITYQTNLNVFPYQPR